MGNRYSGISGGSSGSNLVYTTDFLIEVAKGQIQDHSLIFKYGRSPELNSSDAPADVWTYADNAADYTYPTVAATNYISSSDNADTTEITVEGLDADWNPQTATVTLAGNTKTEIGTGLTWIRVFRAFNSGSSSIAGTVYVYEDDTTSTPGVPDDPTKVKAHILAVDQQTYMALYTVPDGHTAYFLGGAVSLITGASSSKSATVELQTTNGNGIFLSKELIQLVSAGSSNFAQDLHALGPLAIPARTDVKARIRTIGANSTGITAYYGILLVRD